MTKTFSNPVSFTDGQRHTNPDPFVLRWCGTYYCYATDEFGVKVSVSKDLVHWTYRGYAISEEEYHYYWAPSVCYRNGIFYMYYSNIPVEEQDCHQQHLKLAKAEHPEGPFIYQKTFFDQFSIDSHPVIRNGEMYLFYSVNDWFGTEEKIAGTCILLDKMSSPEEFEGNPRPVVVPGLAQEIYAANRFGDGRDWYTIEGACPVERDGKYWILYSANAYENVDYFVGTAVAKNKECLSDMEWEKYPDSLTWMPLLKKNEHVEGTGHNTVTKAPNLVDDWIVYHGRNALEELKPGVEQREMRIDPLFYSDKRILCMGPSAGEIEVPQAPKYCLAEQEMLKSERFLTDSPAFYIMELWISALKEHTGARFGIYLDYQDQRNYTELQIYTGRKEIRVISSRDGICMTVLRESLPKDFDYTVPHLIQVQRCCENYLVKLDEDVRMEAVSVMGEVPGKIGVKPYFTKVMLHNFSMTEYAHLSGKTLQKLSSFYCVAHGEILERGLAGTGEMLRLDERKTEEKQQIEQAYTEEFSLEVSSLENEFCFSRGEKELLHLCKRRGSYSVYHFVRGGQEWFLTDSGITETYAFDGDGEMEPIPGNIKMKGLRITDYRYTKNSTETQKVGEKEDPKIQ